MPQLPLQETPHLPAGQQPVPLPPANPQSPPRLTAEDVSAFLDGFLPLQLQRDDVAGATLGITLDGKPLVLKGYGYANWKKKTPVDPVTTTFRLASLSKMFTYTAMMQQVEQGRLDLDADVNRYLDFQVAPGPEGIGNAPITLRQLATHTAGFEEELHDFGSDKSGRLPMDLRTFLIRNQPHRFARPGAELAYSNYGVALIGYIVSRVSGEAYPEYVQRHIFAPLGMTHSSFEQPLPIRYARSLGYLGTQKADTGFEGFEEAPAGGLSSTAADMGRFGQMLLGGGALDGARVLRPGSVALFFTPQFAPGARVSPWNLGFYPETRNGYTFTGHGGDLIAFHSQFWVEPTHRLTFFISYNSQKSSGVARTELFRAFVDRYLPGPGSDAKSVKMSQQDLAAYAGFYSSSRRADSTKLRLLGPLGARRVRAHDGWLSIAGANDLYGAPMRFLPVGGDTFYNAQEQGFLHFTRDLQGRVNGYVSPSHSDRLRGAMSPAFLRPTGIVALVCLLLVVGAAAVRTWRRLFQRRRPPPQAQPGTRWVPWLMQAAMWGSFLVLLDALAILQHIANADSLFAMSHLDHWLRLQNILTGAALVLLAAGVVSGVVAALQRVRWITRCKLTLVTLSCAWFGWFFLYFHFLGSATQY